MSSSNERFSNERLRELFERNLILLEPIIRRKMKDRQRIISKFSKCSNYLTRIDEENDDEKNEKMKRNKEI